MQGLSTQDFLSFCIPLGRFVALLAVVSVASVGFSYLIGAVGNVVALDGIIVNNAAASTVTVGYALTYAFVVIGAVLAALLAFKNV
ncbi:MAG: hypothetical protein WBZ42_01335 [Halobacteriota archaeon]